MSALNSWALTSVADVKETLGVTGTSQDGIITRKINQATDMIEAFCGKNNDQHFIATIYTDEEYDGTGTNQLILRNRPVTLFGSMYQRDTTQNTNDWTLVNSDYYFVDATSGVIDCNFGILNYWNLYKCTYTAGFASIPSDLSEACAMLAGSLFDNGVGGNAIKQKSQGPKTIQYYDNSQSGSLIEQLGLDDMLQRYVTIPILADK